MVPESLAAETRRRSDETVRWLRAESLRRIERRARAGMSSCILGTMVSLLLFVALEARRMYWIGTANDAAGRAEAACAQFDRRQAEIDAVKREQLANAFDAEEVRRIGAREGEALETARRFARAEGCDAAAPTPPSPAPVQATPAPVPRAVVQGTLHGGHHCGAYRPSGQQSWKRFK